MSSSGTAAQARLASPPGWPVVTSLMALSGFAGLGYQIVWAQQFGAWLGHEIVAVLAVVAAFFGGLALGAQVLGARITRSAVPGRWYAGLEAVIGLWALVLAVITPAAGAVLVQWIGVQPATAWHWGLAFAGPFVLLLPATAAMGATLPAIERVFARLRHEGYAIGGLYAANTAGAVAGVLGATFWLVPGIGLAATAALCAAASLLCGALAWYFLPASVGAPTGPSVSVARTARPDPGVLLALAITGLLGIGYEVAVVRVLSQVTESTVYTFALSLAVYLVGAAAGGAVYQRWLAQASDAGLLRGRLLGLTVAACLLGTATLWGSEAARITWTDRLGSGALPGMLSEAALAVAALALPALAMGALFSHLCVQAKDAGWRLGSALAANTLGAALAPPLVGLLLLPTLGAAAALTLLALGYLLLVPLPAWRRGATAAALAATGVAAAGMLAFAPPLGFITVPEGGRLVSHRDGVMAAVSVTEDARGVLRLHINNRDQEGSSATRVADARQAWIPLLLHADPKSALFLGLGTGMTAAGAAADPALRVDAVELLPEVIDAAALFVPALATPGSAGAPRVFAADARRFVRAGSERYDVIVADLFHPARSGAGALYSVEHFAAVRQRLAPGGLFCQWLPLHQLDMDSLRSVVKAFLAVYPDAVAVLATNSLDTPVIGLVGRPTPMAKFPPIASMPSTPVSPVRRAALSGLQLPDTLAVQGSVVAGPRALAAFAASAVANTDDRPIVAHGAPRLAYATDAPPRARLMQLLRLWQAEPADLLGTPADAQAEQAHRQLAAYWAARNRYLEAGMAVRPSADVRQMLAQVQAPLLDVLRISPDFRPAYDPLLNMAAALGSTDQAAALELLAALVALQPARPEAGRAMQALAGAASLVPAQQDLLP